MLDKLWAIKERLVKAVAYALGDQVWTVDELLPPACVQRYGSDFFSGGFDPTSEKASLLFFAELSMLAYSESEEECHKFLSRLFKIPLDKQLLYDLGNKNTDPDILMFEHEDDAFVAFRGTEPFSVIDWKTDAAVTMDPLETLNPTEDTLYEALENGGAEVHRGFWSSASLVREDEVAMGLLKKTIWICGHR